MVTVTIALVTAGCSSTVGHRNNANVTVPGQTSGASVQTNASPSSQSAPAGVPTSSAGAVAQASASASVPGTTRVAPKGPIKMGTGVTATTIKLGFHVLETASAIRETGANTSGANQRPTINAVVNYVNAHGGIAGRKIDPIIRIYDVSTANFVTEAQAACSQFTEDDHVFAGLTTADELPDTFISCLAAHKTPAVVFGDGSYVDTDFSKWPNFYALQNPSGDRWAFYVDQLVGSGFLSKSNKIGIVTQDIPRNEHIADQVIKPRLAAHGLKVTREAIVTHIESVSQLTSTGADVNNAILRFRAANVDRVVFVATGGGAPFFWLQDAEQQHYRPLYAFSSDDKIDQDTDNAPAVQLHGARGVGWLPVLDVNAPQDPGGRPGYTLCKAIFKGAGMTFSGPRYAERDAMGACDTIYFVKTALDRASALTQAGLRAAVEGMGAAFKPASVFASNFSAPRHWAPALYRNLAFEDKCACWKYQRSTQTI